MPNTVPASPLVNQMVSDTDDTTLGGNDMEKAVGENTGAEPEKNEAPAGPPLGYGDAPDGGLAAWMVVFGTWCTGFCSFGWINSAGTFQEYFENGPLRTYSSSTISWIPSLQFFFMFALGPLIGRIYDRHGPRQLILVGSFLHVFGLMMASISHTYYQFLLSQGVCSSIGVACIFQPALSCVPSWFHRRRGAAYGVVATGSSLGGVIFPIVASRLIDSTGFGWAMRACAFLNLGLLVLANLTVRSRVHSAPGFQPHPALTGAQMAVAFREPPFVLLLVGMGLLTFGIFTPVTYLPSEARATGDFSNNFVPYIVSIYNAGSLFGRLLSGLISDHAGKFNTFIGACLLAGIFVLGLWIPGNGHAEIIAFAVVFGFFSGAYVSLIGSLVAQVSPPKEIGYRTGLSFVASALPALTTSPISGAILSSHGWTGVKVFAGVFLIVGSAVVAVSRFCYIGFKPLKVF